jgi:hypothetical protein
MLARVAVAAALSVIMLANPADAGDWRRHHGRGHDWKHGHWHGHRPGPPVWHHHRHSHGSARIVIWQPAPVYRAYPAPYPVYVPAPMPVVQAPIQAVPLANFQDESGRYCREYQRMADIGGRQQQVYGTACMMPDGSWQIVSE